MTPNTDSIFSQLLDDLAARVVALMTCESIEKSPEFAARLLDVPSAAEYLSVSAHSVRHQIKKGLLPVVRRGSRVFVDRRELDRQIDQSRVQAAPARSTRRLGEE